MTAGNPSVKLPTAKIEAVAEPSWDAAMRKANSLRGNDPQEVERLRKRTDIYTFDPPPMTDEVAEAIGRAAVTRPTPTLLDQAMRQAGCTDIQINMTMDVLYHLPEDE